LAKSDNRLRYPPLRDRETPKPSNMSSSDNNNRLMIVSNRLPVGIKRIGLDQHEFSPSCGGLVTGLKGLAHNEVTFLWYGWPGTTFSQEQCLPLKEVLMERFNAVPVPLDRETAELYYNGFSSKLRSGHDFLALPS